MVVEPHAGSALVLETIDTPWKRAVRSNLRRDLFWLAREYQLSTVRALTLPGKDALFERECIAQAGQFGIEFQWTALEAVPAIAEELRAAAVPNMEVLDLDVFQTGTYTAKRLIDPLGFHFIWLDMFCSGNQLLVDRLHGLASIGPTVPKLAYMTLATRTGKHRSATRVRPDGDLTLRIPVAAVCEATRQKFSTAGGARLSSSEPMYWIGYGDPRSQHSAMMEVVGWLLNSDERLPPAQVFSSAGILRDKRGIIQQPTAHS